MDEQCETSQNSTSGYWLLVCCDMMLEYVCIHLNYFILRSVVTISARQQRHPLSEVRL